MFLDITTNTCGLGFYRTIENIYTITVQTIKDSGGGGVDRQTHTRRYISVHYDQAHLIVRWERFFQPSCSPKE